MPRKPKPFAVAVIDDVFGDAIALRNGAVVPVTRLPGDCGDAVERRGEMYARFLNRSPAERKALLRRLRREKRYGVEAVDMEATPGRDGCDFHEGGESGIIDGGAGVEVTFSFQKMKTAIMLPGGGGDRIAPTFGEVGNG